MPKKLHEALKKAIPKEYPDKSMEEINRIIYGTMANIEKKQKGKRKRNRKKV